MIDFPPQRFKIAGRRVATIAGVPVFVGPGVLLGMALGALPKLAQGLPLAAFTAVMVLLATLAHEAAHAVVARRHGIGVAVMSIGSGAFVLCTRAASATVEVRIFAAGSLCNLALAAGLGAVAAASGPAAPFVVSAAQVNLLLGVSNLVPAFALDGGYIGCLLLAAIVPARWALTIVGALGLMVEVLAFVMLVALPVMGWPLVWSYSGASFALLAWAWRTPPLPPPAQAGSQADRPVPRWLIRHPPQADEPAAETAGRR